MFFLTTLKIESDLFVFYLLPILTASIYVRRPSYRYCFVFGTCLALILSEYAEYKLTGGKFDSQPDTFGLKRLLLNVILIRVVALFGAYALSSALVSCFRNSRSLLNSYLDNLPIAVWRKLKDGTFTYVNRSMANISNRRYHQIIGYKDTDLYGVYAERFLSCDARVINGKCSFTDTMEPFPLKDGTIQFNHVHKVPITNQDGEVIGTQGFLVDISEYSKPLPDAQLLAALASHASILTHEIQNEIGIISLYARYTRELTVKSAGQPDFVTHKEVIRQCDVIEEITSSLTTRLTDLARLRRNVKKEVTLNFVSLVDDELRRLRPITSPNQIKPLFGSSPILIIADPVHLRDAVRNLILNAVEAVNLWQHPNRAVHLQLMF